MKNLHLPALQTPPHYLAPPNTKDPTFSVRLQMSGVPLFNGSIPTFPIVATGVALIDDARPKYSANIAIMDTGTSPGPSAITLNVPAYGGWGSPAGLPSNPPAYASGDNPWGLGGFPHPPLPLIGIAGIGIYPQQFPVPGGQQPGRGTTAISGELCAPDNSSGMNIGADNPMLQELRLKRYGHF